MYKIRKYLNKKSKKNPKKQINKIFLSKQCLDEDIIKLPLLLTFSHGTTEVKWQLKHFPLTTLELRQRSRYIKT